MYVSWEPVDVAEEPVAVAEAAPEAAQVQRRRSLKAAKKQTTSSKEPAQRQPRNIPEAAQGAAISN